MKRKVLHIITGLEVGGAEIMLCRLLEHADQSQFEHSVICLLKRGVLADRLEAAGVEKVMCLDMRGLLKMPIGALKLLREIKSRNPDIIQTWLTHSNFFGTMAAWVAGQRNVVWSIHSGQQDRSRMKKNVRILSDWLARMSSWAPRMIVSCSRTALERHVELGFDRHCMRIIHNGTDMQLFRPVPEASEELRNELEIPEYAPVVGIVGRWTPEKDFDTFFKGALALEERMPSAHFIVCGKGMDENNKETMRYVRRAQNSSHFHLLGLRNDMPRIYTACKIVVMTSVSEAFPLTLGEAMACGTPCVTTNVGDCNEIIADTGATVPPGNAFAIARAWEQMLRTDPAEYNALKVQAQERISTFFSMERCIQQYEDLYVELTPKEVNGVATNAEPAAA